jgi:hypothetical protein
MIYRDPPVVARTRWFHPGYDEVRKGLGKLLPLGKHCVVCWSICICTKQGNFLAIRCNATRVPRIRTYGASFHYGTHTSSPRCLRDNGAARGSGLDHSPARPLNARQSSDGAGTGAQWPDPCGGDSRVTRSLPAAPVGRSGWLSSGWTAHDHRATPFEGCEDPRHNRTTTLRSETASTNRGSGSASRSADRSARFPVPENFANVCSFSNNAEGKPISDSWRCLIQAS